MPNPLENKTAAEIQEWFAEPVPRVEFYNIATYQNNISTHLSLALAALRSNELERVRLLLNELLDMHKGVQADMPKVSAEQAAEFLREWPDDG